MPATDYYLAWSIYLFASVVGLAMAWLWLRPIKIVLIRWWLLSLLLVVLLLPAPLEPGSAFWTPAFIAAVIEGVDYGPEAALARLRPMLWLVLLTWVSLGAWLTWRRRKMA